MENYVTLDDLSNIKKLYREAVKQEYSNFTYKGHVLLTAYAKYLIEYLESLKKK